MPEHVNTLIVNCNVTKGSLAHESLTGQCYPGVTMCESEKVSTAGLNFYWQLQGLLLRSNRLHSSHWCLIVSNV